MATKGKRTTQRTATPTRTRAKWEKAFLAALRIHGNVSVACHVTGIERSTAYRRRNANKTFKLAWDDAIDESGDWLEHEARRRAEEGTLKPVYFKGELVGFEREYSDALMAMMLKGLKPDKYADKLIVKIKSEWTPVFDEAGVSASDILEAWVQRYVKAKQEAANAS